MHEALVGLDKNELQNLLEELAGGSVPTFRAQQIYDAIYRQRVGGLEAITTLPRDLRGQLQAAAAFGLPTPAQVFQSVDGTKRYLLKLADGKTVETVLMPEGDRYTFCISSQVGCPVNCGFCLTALLGLERNLTAGEIAGQVLYVAAANGLSADVSKLNVVLMGQGEPLLNFENVLKATRLLTDPKGVGLSERRLTLSTSGIIPKIALLAKEPVRPKLAISLNASTEEQRRQLMPITRKYPLKELIEACRAYPLRAWERLTFEYVLLRDVNDADDDARRIVKLLTPLNCKVNLIALNPGPGIPFEAPAPERIASFQEIVRRAIPCFLRKPRGLDIYAACGQLKRISDERMFPVLDEQIE
ncbi:MAG TPA: 23S rRNA (adenine(2503)-C(2))-methyltransferase RlmN [Bryobacteraceae bacterium]|nr:23S rRNA (adenine(2503)-C(2))-methyltransferase RlmN [Bryobacteraceae bacterium]